MQLARHLMNLHDNDHVEIHELRGFVGNDLESAFKEAHAISLGTKCSQFLFSLSLSPPELENVSIDIFEKAIENIEAKIGLAGQPRTIVFHEKNGRRHAHCVWSRIDAARMRSINLPHFKMKLQDISRQLYLENNWQMPPGLLKGLDSDPLNYTIAEAQQAKRNKIEPKMLKSLFQKCWAQSDSQPAFSNALKEHGFMLAKGDRRGFVAVDRQGEIYCVSRWVGLKVKEMSARLGNADDLPSVEEALGLLAAHLPEEIDDSAWQADKEYQSSVQELELQRQALATEHRTARVSLGKAQEEHRIQETKITLSQLPTGMRLVWAKLSGQYQQILQKYEVSVQQSKQYDRAQLQELIRLQLKQRQALQQEIRQFRYSHEVDAKTLWREAGSALREKDDRSSDRRYLPVIDPKQPLILPKDDDAQNIAAKVRRNPRTILEVITDKKDVFGRSDIVHGLSNYIDDPRSLQDAIEETLQSQDLVEVRSEPSLLYTTVQMQRLALSLSGNAQAMATNHICPVKTSYVNAAITQQNKSLQKSVGANLSEEQEDAIRHVLGKSQLLAIVGYAGAGKSTMLAAARQAWEKQGYRVLGASLSGKAADGLEKSSGIPSRTLSSFDYSWKHGFHTLQPNDVLVIDEAGMVGTRQLLRFTEEAKKCGAKLVLVGDPEQLQPIAAGKPFKDVSEQIGAFRLTEIRRQKEGWQRRASIDLANNRMKEAIQAYEDHGFVTRTDDRSWAITKLVGDYLDDIEQRGPDASRLALVHRRKDVHLINQSIRATRKSQGHLMEEKLFKTDHGPRAFSVGDRIQFTRNDHELGLRNGSLGIVDAIQGREISVILDSLDHGARTKRVTLCSRLYSSFDHGYATTIHKSQGATVDRAFVMGSNTMDRHLAYVAMTRHKETLHFYADSETARGTKFENPIKFKASWQHSHR